LLKVGKKDVDARDKRGHDAGAPLTTLPRGWRDRGGRSIPMQRTLIRYKTKPDRVQENQRLIESVFAELEAKSPDGIRYLVLRLDDGTFVHFVAVDPKVAVTSVPELEAFRLFQSGHKERCVEPPQSGVATIVGNYRMLDEP